MLPQGPSESKIAQARVVIRAAPQRPPILAAVLRDRQVVDAGYAQSHQAVFVEFPVFIAVAAKPMAAVVVAFVGEPDGYAVVTKPPDLLDQPLIQFARPLARQKFLNGVAALREFGAVAPTAVRGVGECDAGRVSRVPGVLSHARLLRGGFHRQRRQWWSVHGFPKQRCQ